MSDPAQYGFRDSYQKQVNFEESAVRVYREPGEDGTNNDDDRVNVNSLDY
jgi:hypothetical protein